MLHQVYELGEAIATPFLGARCPMWAASGRDGRGCGPSTASSLAVLGAASFFDGYDTSVKIARAHADPATTSASRSRRRSWMFALLYLGALPPSPITRRADRVGRRKMLILSVLGYTVASGLAAMAGTQLVRRLPVHPAAVRRGRDRRSCGRWRPRSCRRSPAVSAFGLARDELGARHRLRVDPLRRIFEAAGLSWRWLYVVGMPPLLFVAYLRRRLPESRRFEAARDAHRLAERWHEILQPPRAALAVLVVATTFLLQLAPYGVHLQHRLPAGGPRDVDVDRQPHARARRPPGHPDHGVGRPRLGPLRAQLVGCGFAVVQLDRRCVLLLAARRRAGAPPGDVADARRAARGVADAADLLVRSCSRTPLRGQAGSWSNARRSSGGRHRSGSRPSSSAAVSQSATATLLAHRPGAGRRHHAADVPRHPRPRARGHHRRRSRRHRVT